MYTFIKRQQDYFNKYAASTQQRNNTKPTTTPTASVAKTPSAMDAYNKGMLDNNYTGDKARNYFRNGNFDNMAYYQRWQKAKTNDERAKIQQEWKDAKNQSKADYINRLKSINPEELKFNFKGDQLEWTDKYRNIHHIDARDAQAAGLNIQYAQQNDWNRGKDNYSKPGKQIGWHAATDGSARGTIPMHEVRTVNYGTDAMNKIWGWANPKTTANNTASGTSTGTGNPPVNGTTNSQPVNNSKVQNLTSADPTNTGEQKTKTSVAPTNNVVQNKQTNTGVEELSPEQVYKQDVMNWSKANNKDIVAAQSRIKKWNASAKQRQAFEQSLNSRIKHLKEYAQAPEDLEELKKLESYKQQLQAHNAYMSNLEKTLTTGIAQNPKWNAAQTGWFRRLFGDKVNGVDEDAYGYENNLNLSTGNNDANYLENNMNAINRFINYNYSGAEQRAADPRNVYRYAPWNQEMQRIGR